MQVHVWLPFVLYLENIGFYDEHFMSIKYEGKARGLVLYAARALFHGNLLMKTAVLHRSRHFVQH